MPSARSPDLRESLRPVLRTTRAVPASRYAQPCEPPISARDESVEVRWFARRCLATRAASEGGGGSVRGAGRSGGGAAEVTAGDGLAGVLAGAGAGAQGIGGGVLGEAADVLLLQLQHPPGVHLERRLACPTHRLVP